MGISMDDITRDRPDTKAVYCIEFMQFCNHLYSPLKLPPQWQLAPSSVAFCPNGVEKYLISENPFFLFFWS